MRSHGQKDTKQIIIPGYRVYTINASGERDDGSTIAIKYEIRHKVYDDFDTDVLALEIDTTLGPIILSTTYLPPPRRPYLPFTDFYRLLSNSIPTYMIGDLNARHKHLGNINNNTVDRSIIQLLTQGSLLYLGLHFPTFISQGAATKPDIIVSNKRHYLNSFCEPGKITTYDHLPIVFKVSTKPFLIQHSETYKLNKADRNTFRHTYGRPWLSG